MPINYLDYPDDWTEISAAIREREGNKCKFCGVENGAVGARDKAGRWHNENDIHNMNSDEGYMHFGQFPKIIKIVLTVAHLGAPRPDGSPGDPDDKHDNRPENLAALCQRCHLNHDRADNNRKAAATRARKKREAIAATGQIGLGL